MLTLATTATLAVILVTFVWRLKTEDANMLVLEKEGCVSGDIDCDKGIIGKSHNIIAQRRLHVARDLREDHPHRRKETTGNIYSMQLHNIHF